MNGRECSIDGMKLTGKTKAIGESPVLEPVCPSHLSSTAPGFTDGSSAVRHR